MNALLNRKGLAKTSATPGKTQTINFFEVNSKFYFVDLPGYGYAKVPKTVKKTWSQAMTEYLVSREALRLVVQLIDARHPPTPKDMEMLALLEEAEAPTLIVATKVDKLTRSERAQLSKTIRKTLGLDDESVIVPFSAVTREGVVPIWNIIEEQLGR